MDRAILEAAIADLQALVPLMEKDKERYIGTPKLKEWQKRSNALNRAIKVAKAGI